MRTIHARGNHYQMGLQHGAAVLDMRPLILQAMTPHLLKLEAREGVEPHFAELLDVLPQVAPALLDMIRGLSESLGFEFTTLVRYAYCYYLEARTDPTLCPPAPSEECTSWAASGEATRSGEPILVKNRDTNLERGPIQAVATYEPDGGYRYLCTTNAGSAGVPSSGMNEKGLCVADTRDRYADYGPGLTYGALMMEVLEKHDSVRSALDFLRGARRAGGSNLILADLQGDMAVFEVGHRHYGLREADGHVLVNANHPVSAEMRQFVAGVETESLANSRRRYEGVHGELHRMHGRIDARLARRLMASHDERLGPLCRHDLPGIAGGGSGTISCAIYLPARRELWISQGPPCRRKYQLCALPE